MGKAVIAAFRDAGFRDVISPPAIASAAWRWRSSTVSSGSPPEGIAADILVNVTPLGMAGGAESETPPLARQWWNGPP